MPRAIIAILIVGFVIYGLIDCIISDSTRVRAMPKAAWLVIILLVPVIGVVLWLVFGRPTSAPQVSSQPLPKPMAPDDDPQFLRNLSIAREQKAEEARLEAKRKELEERERRLQQEQRGEEESGQENRKGS